MKSSPFRAWLQNKWMEYKSEFLRIEGVPCTESPQLYFRRYKWFLKQLYKDDISKL